MELFGQILSYFKPPNQTQGIQIVDGKILSPENQILLPDEIIELPSKSAHKPNNLLTLDTLRTHKALQPLKKGYVPIGLSRKTGDLIQSSWQRMTTGIIAGRRNHGKSSILKAMILLALHARRSGLKCKIYLFDPHHNLPDAIGTFFKPILDQFDGYFLGMESLKEGKHLVLFHQLLEHVQTFQEEGFDESAPWHFVFMDESDLFFQDKEHGKENYSLVRDLVNLRKGRIFFLLSFADTTKAGSGNIGTGLVAAGTTVFCVNYDLTRARLVLQGQGEAQRALNLPVGYAAVKIPDAKVQVCQMPYITEADLEPFLTSAPITEPAPEQTQAPTPDRIILKDGEIIRKEQITAWDKLFGGFFYKHPFSGMTFYTPKGMISETQIESELQQLAEFDEEPEAAAEPEPPKFQPEPEHPALIPTTAISLSYLADDDQSDFDAFLTYLEPRLSKRSIADYGQDLKALKRHLNGDISEASIQKVLKSFEYHRAMRLKATLFNYGQYRLTQGDPFIATITARLTFQPEEPKETEKKTLSPKEIEMYHQIARRLCEEKKREGIWIELLLLGVKPSKIEGVKILNKSTVQDEKKKVKIPDWLHRAFTVIPEQQWRLGRKTIHKEVSHYEITPALLNTAGLSKPSKLAELQSERTTTPTSTD